MASPHTHGDSLRAHDKGVYDWLGTLLVDYGTIAGTPRNSFPILRVFAAPQRAFATVTDLLVAQGFLDGATAAEMRETGNAEWPKLPLPIATIERDEPYPDSSQANVVGVFRRAYLNPVTGLWEYHRHPGHFLTPYRITFRCDKRYTENFMREWVMAQLGKLGAAHNELLVPVVHSEPWGLTQHAMRFEGSQDLSQLEGEESRLLVFELSFTLRTWIFYPPTPGGDIIHGVGVDAAVLADPEGEVAAPSGRPEPVQVSANLWTVPVLPSQFPTMWPKTGDATVQAATASTLEGAADLRGLRAQVETPDDSVELAERLCRRDVDGRAVVYASFAYRASGGPAVLEADGHDLDGSGAVTMAYQLALPATRTWRRVHAFTVVRDPAFLWSVVGAGDAADVTVADLDIRQVYDGSRISPGADDQDGGFRVFKWTALEPGAYLVIGVCVPASGAAVTVTAQDSLYDPVFQPAQQVDPDVNVGFVFLVQPRDGTMALRVPAALSLDVVYAHRYDGPYNGHSL